MSYEYHFVYSEQEVCERLGVNRNTFSQSIHPLMVEGRYARKLSRDCAYDGRFLWQWELYIATRKNLIQAGIWHQKTPYSLEDMNSISIDGMYEDYMPLGEAEATSSGNPGASQCDTCEGWPNAR